jgi:hypothetical protein
VSAETQCIIRWCYVANALDPVHGLNREAARLHQLDFARQTRMVEDMSVQDDKLRVSLSGK